MSVLREIITRLTLQADPAKLAQFESAIQATKTAAQGASIQIAAIAAAAGLAVRGLARLAEEGAQARQIATAYAELGGTLEEIEKFRGVTQNLVSDTDIQKAMNLGRLFKIPSEQIPALMKIAQGSAVALGTSVSKNLDDVFTAMARGSVMIADNLGTQMGKIEDVNAAYAKQHNLNVQLLTDEQKKQAFVEAFVAKSQRQLALAEKASQNSFALLSAASQNLRGLFADIAFDVANDFLKTAVPRMQAMTKWLTTWWQGADGGARKVRVLVGSLRILASVLSVIVAIKLAIFLKAAIMLTIAWAKATWAAVAAFGALKIAMLAIPIILASLALLLEDIIVWSRGGDSAIGAFIDKFYDAPGILGKFARFLRDNTWEIIAFAEKVWEMAKSVPLWLWQIYDAARQWWGKLVEASQGGVKGLMAAWSSGFARDLGATLWDWIADSLAALRARLMGAVSSAVTSVIDAVWSGLSGAGSGVSGWFGGIVSKVKGAARSVIDGVIEALGPLYPSLVSLFGALWQLGVALAKMFFALARIAYTVWTLKGRVIWAVVKAILPHALALGQRVIEVVVRILVRVAEWVGQAAAWVGEKVTWLIDNVVKPAIAWIGEAAAWLAGKAAWVASKVKVLVDWLGQAANWLITKVTELANWITEKVTWVADKATWVTTQIADGITWVAQKVADGAALVAKGLAYILDTYVTPAIQWLTTGVEWITKIFTDIADGIGGAFESAFNAVMTFAQPIIDLIDGLKGTVDWAAEKLGLGGGEATAGALMGVSDSLQRAIQSGDMSQLTATAGPRLVSMGGVPVGPDGKPVGGGTTNTVGTLQVNIQGSTNMGPGELATAASQGVQEGMTKAAGRDLSVGGG